MESSNLKSQEDKDWEKTKTKNPTQNRVLKDYGITKTVVAYAVRIPEGEEREGLYQTKKN